MDYVHGGIEEMSQDEMERLLRKAKYGRLGLAFENEAYVVPISHICDANHIWFHIAREGKKTTYLQANPQACFQVDEWAETGWGSVICYGMVTLSDDLAAKKQFMKLAAGQVPPDEQLHQMAMYICALEIQEMTGRKSHGYNV
jgi:nitroimidazol reductase NimA-like FMN-containing flavoprotein (pyridoxamine 5'-phosphate oxidase superfamily)